jgi:hypothetical protein
MLLIQLNNVLFRHAHRLTNGKIISHAHPYKPIGNGPFQPNNHTNNELFLLDVFTGALFISNLAFSFTFLIREAIGFKPTFFFLLPYRFQLSYFYSLRGPPVFKLV